MRSSLAGRLFRIDHDVAVIDLQSPASKRLSSEFVDERVLG